MRAEDILFNSKKQTATGNDKIDEVNSIAQKYIAAAANMTAAPKKSDGKITTASDVKKPEAPKYKPEDNPIIRALGAGDYGAGKDTRVDKVLKGASQSTASSLANALGTVSGGTGELTMGQSAQAAVKGQKQQTLEAEKKQRQNAEVQQKLYNKADELSAKSEKNIADAKEGLGNIGQTLVDVGVAGTQMLGDAVLNLASPGAGLIGMGLRSFGSGAQEQRLNGGTETDMLLGGLKSAAIEVLTEMLGGFYGKSKISGAVNDAIKSIGKSDVVPALLMLVKEGAEEAVEEILSDIVNPLADRVLNLDNKRGSWEKIGVFSEENIKAMIHDGIVGGILGFVGGGGQIIENALGSDANTQTTQNAAEQPTAEGQQTTPTAEGNTVTEAQTQLNSALQNDEVQPQTNPIIEAINNANNAQNEAANEQQTIEQPQTAPLTAERAAEITQTIQQVVEGARAADSNATVDDVIADMQASPADYGLTEEEAANDLRSLGAAVRGEFGPPTEVEQWIADAQNEGESAVHPVSNEQIRGLYNNARYKRYRDITDVPLFDKNGKLTRGGIAAILNSGLTSDELAPLLTELTYEGVFSYDEATDKRALSRARRNIKKNGYGDALRQFLNDTADGKVSKDNTVLGIMLYTNAVQNGDFATAINVAIALAADGTASAQAMQARRLLATLTPTGKLYTAVKIVEKMSEQQTKRVGEKKIDRAATEVEGAAEESVKEAAEKFKEQPAKQNAGKPRKRSAQDNADENYASGAQMIGEPFWFEYEEAVGEAVRKSLERRMENTVARPAMFSKTLIKTLTDIAKDTMPETAKGKKASPAEIIADYLNNKEFYDAAWQKAQEEITRRYGDEEKPTYNEQIMNGLQEFLNTASPITQPAGTKIMLRALAESALDIDETNSDIVIQNALGVVGIDTAIADSLIAEIEQIINEPLDEGTLSIIDDAARQYVLNIISESTARNAENGKAESDIVRTQVRAVLNSIGEKLSQIAASTRSQKTAVATAVTEELTARWGFSADDAADIADIVETEFSEMVRESMEARLDSMYGKADARVKRTLAEKLAENINLGAFESTEYALDAAEKLLGARVEIDPDIAQAYVEALEDGNEEDIDEAYRALVQSIAEQMPKTWREQADVIRYTAMLGAPLTHIRNTGGNAGFAPVVMVKNAIGAAGESFTVNVLGKDIERTKAFVSPIATAKVIGSAVGDWGGGIRQNRTGGEKGSTERIVSLSKDSDGDVALVATAWMDYAEVADDIMSGGKYSEDAAKDTLARDIQDARKTWKGENAAGRAANAVTEGVSTALEVEDQWFTQPAYAQALAGWLKANGITAEQYANGEISDEQKSTARKYAVKEAQKATYRDTNAFSQAVSRLRVRRAAPDASLAEKAVRGVGRVFVEGQNPFFKTPANILVRAVEYSPIGLLGELSVGSVQLGRGDITAAEYIDGLAEGLTGTGLWLLGIWLAKLGVLTGGSSGDDKQDEFDELQGKQDYAVCVGGKYYTLSWLAPEALPVFMGVEFVNRSRDGVSMWDAAEAAINLSEPMLEMSMLSGIQDSLDAITYSEHKLGAYAANSCFNYLTQYVPSLFGQIERVTEETRQSTFVDKTAETPTSVQRFAGKVMNKLPGEYNQIDFIDAWGRTQSTGNAAQRAVNNLLNPAYVSDKRTTEVETELQRLYDAGYGDVLPSRTTYSQKVNGEYLTKEQYTKYATTKGQTSLALVEKFMNMDAYNKMSDAAKNDAIKDIYDYATDEAKRAVNPKAEVPTWHDEAKASGNAAKYIADRAAYDDAADGKTGLAGLVEAAENGASEDILLANMSDAAKDAYASAKAGGASIENFANAYNYYYNEAKGDDKQMQVINYCYSVGKSPAEREALFNALYPKYKGKPIDWS